MPLEKKVCAYCNRTYQSIDTPKRKFCSQSCAGMFKRMKKITKLKAKK